MKACGDALPGAEGVCMSFCGGMVGLHLKVDLVAVLSDGDHYEVDDFWSPMPPAVLAVTAEGASCAARAVPSNSVSCMLAARRVPTDLFPHGVPGAGREPNASLKTNASSGCSLCDRSCGWK